MVEPSHCSNHVCTLEKVVYSLINDTKKYLKRYMCNRANLKAIVKQGAYLEGCKKHVRNLGDEVMDGDEALPLNVATLKCACAWEKGKVPMPEKPPVAQLRYSREDS
jgi:hypothetical protein